MRDKNYWARVLKERNLSYTKQITDYYYYYYYYIINFRNTRSSLGTWFLSLWLSQYKRIERNIFRTVLMGQNCSYEV